MTNKGRSLFRGKRSIDLIATILVLLALTARWLWLTWEIDHGRPDRMTDFANYYLASRILLAGGDIYQISLKYWYSIGKNLGISSRIVVYLYSPLLALLMIPVAVLPYMVAVLIWGVVTIGAFVGAAWMFAWRAALPAWPMLLSLLVFMPVNVTMNYGQINGLILLLMGMFLWSRSWGPPALALAIWIKAWPIWLWLHALWRRKFRTAAIVVLYRMLIGIIMMIALGPSRAQSFLFHGLPDIIRLGLRIPPENEFWQAFFDPSFSKPPSPLRLFLSLLIGLLTLVLTRPLYLPWEWSAGLFVAAGNLITPYSLYHHLVWSLIPLWVLIKEKMHGALTPFSTWSAILGVSLVDLQWILGFLRHRAGWEALREIESSEICAVAGTTLIWTALALHVWRSSHRMRQQAIANGTPAPGDGK
jgi:hypothetical protein